MNTFEKSDSNKEEHIMKAISNIKAQLNCITRLYNISNSKHSELDIELEKESEKINNEIEELVNSIPSETTETEKLIHQLTFDVKDNDTLLISERTNKVFLPYIKSDLEAYLNEYPDEYNSLSDVVNQEYIVPYDRFRNQTISRFKETYCLMRDLEMKSIIESFKKAIELMFNSKLNPIILSACKSEDQLNDYIQCVEHNNMENFKHFKIIFDVAPLSSTFKNSFFENNSKIEIKKSKGRHF